jgi:hypothetical protein
MLEPSKTLQANKKVSAFTKMLQLENFTTKHCLIPDKVLPAQC